MRQLSLYLLLISLLFQMPNALANNIKEFEEQLDMHKMYYPTGDLNKISYIKELIEYMFIFDQEIRNKLISNQSDEELWTLLKKVDAFHTSKMKEILKEWGWITVSKFGLEYDQKAWLLVQHADEDPLFQGGVLLILERLADKGETDKKNYAYLYDRVAGKFHKIGMLQKYGTQVIVTNGEIELQPYEGSLEDIDRCRSEVGLEPLEDYLNKIKEIYH